MKTKFNKFSVWKRVLCALLSFFILIGINTGSVFTQSEEALDFYCVGNKEHKLPALDSRFSFMSKYNSYYANTNVKEGDRVIYLTFDAGYENGNIARVLDSLKKHNAKGTFFVLDNLIKRNPELIMRMENEGHTVGNHTKNHPDMTKYKDIEGFKAQLDGLNDVYKSLTGKDVAKFYRPPQGRFSELNLKFANELGYKTVFWSFAYADWDNEKQPDPERALEKILSHIHNGEIMLLHPTSKTNADILDRLLTELEKDGYRFGSLSELSNAENEPSGTPLPTGDSAESGTDGNTMECVAAKKRIALTFDDGPCAKYDGKILDILDKYNIKATFFMIGENVACDKEGAKKIAERGHEIGNHTYSHKKLKKLDGGMLDDEILRTEQIIEEVCGKAPTLFRPPEGVVTDTVLSSAKKGGYTLVLWNVDTKDWTGADSAIIYKNVMKDVKDGSIILCHDYVAGMGHTPEALEKFIPVLLDMGYEFVTVSTLLMQ